jgi:hypothetical protein
MPIRPELRPLYPPHWRELSSHVRFERAEGRCQRCGRPHLALLRCLPDGRWFDEQAATWRDRRGRPARWPDLMETTRFRVTRVVLAAAHLDSDPTNNRPKNLRALCQRCHMLHDRPHHLAQRWITYRRRLAVGDLFLGLYPAMIEPPSVRAAVKITGKKRLRPLQRHRPEVSRPSAFSAPRCVPGPVQIGVKKTPGTHSHQGIVYQGEPQARPSPPPWRAQHFTAS